MPTDPDIASWLEAAQVDRPTSGDRTCIACGYTGGMTVDTKGAICPACLMVLPTEDGLITRTIRCSECSLDFGITTVGKTVICPGCSCFLGTH